MTCISGRAFLSFSPKSGPDILGILTSESNRWIFCFVSDASLIAAAPLEAPAGIETINVRSTREMFDAVMSRVNDVTIFIGCAAVADYRPVKLAEHKIKKQGQAKITLELEPTEDIIASVAADPNRNGRLVAGFAAESQTLLDYAEKKLREKKLDLIVANDIKRADAGFDVETNTATILTRDGAHVELPLQNKREMADRVLDEILRLK